ncbi:MAG: pyridoxal-phosphate dependent enzyme [Lentisphaeria bacterium]|nr:MAG: pyridoxal-phosphate dependent enzyme [Lentisphaeria bacterium]
MGRIFDHITELIGSTPLLRIHRLNDGRADVLAKVEYFNPGGSVKDRVGLAMIEDAEARGLLKPGALIIEPTSGNTGIGLALAAAVKGYRLIPHHARDDERRAAQTAGSLWCGTGADPRHRRDAGCDRPRRRAACGQSRLVHSAAVRQSGQSAIHRRTTAQEILRDTDGEIDAFVAGVGTGGTLTGVGEVLKEKNPAVKIFAVEPDTSAVLSGEAPGAHKLQGIGAGFVPKVLDTDVIDGIFKISAEEAGKSPARRRRRRGSSSASPPVRRSRRR